MKKKEAALIAFKEVLDSAGADGMYSFDIVGAAREVPVEPPRLHRLGDAVLQFFGTSLPPYKPNYSYQLYPTLARLEQSGVVQSDWEEKPITLGGPRRRIYRIAQPETSLEA